MFAFLTISGSISGKCTLLFPSGMIANLNVLKGELHGWGVLFLKDNFLKVCSFRRGEFHGKQYTHDIAKRFMIKSTYQNGSLASI